MKLNQDNAVSFLGTMAHYAESLAEKRDFTALLRYYEDNRGLVDKSDEVSAGSILRHVAQAHASLSDYPLALRTIRLAQNIVARHGDSELLAEVFMTLAGILREMGEYKEARVAFQDAESIFRRNDHPEGQCLALNLLAGLYFRQNDFSNSLGVLMDAIEIARKIGDDKKLAYMIGNIGRIYTFIGDFSEAVKHLTMSVELTREFNDELEVGRSYLSLAYVYIQQGDNERARDTLRKAQTCLSEVNSPRDEVILLTYLGELDYRTAKFADSEQNLLLALRLVDPLGGNSSLAGRVRRHLAELYLRTEENRKAQRYLSAALKMVCRDENSVEFGALLKIKAALADVEGNREQAQNSFDQAIDVLGNSGVRFEKVEALMRAGCAQTFPLRRRMTYLFRAEEFFSGNKIPRRLPEIQRLIGSLEPNESGKYTIAENNSVSGEAGGSDYLTANAEITKFKSQLPLIANADISILLTGETGVGKDHMARHFHSLARPDGPFRAINCASVPETLLESELFGYRKGAFTGADSDKDGLFVAANGGILFLDEIGDMPLALQSKLLGVLEHKRVTPLGSTKEIALDIRLIAATNCDLEAMVESGQFRRDLYYRLSGICFKIPALRDRKEDIPLLLEHFMMKAELIPEGTKLPGEMVHQFLQHPWPGNVRELDNKVKRLEIMTQLVAEGDLVELARNMFSPDEDSKASSLFERVEQFERDLIVEALLAARGNKSEAARILGIHEATVRTKLKRYGISM
ncbi:MAG: sigma 54-interacting transcriptional regulator [bacterium]|nr:sigma 54-interacting transcriptional regulator [bacterium]